MQQVLTLLAAVTPTDVLIEKLEEAIAEYKIYKDEKRIHGLAFNAQLILLKVITDGNIEGAMKITKDFDKMEEYRKMFENKES